MKFNSISFLFFFPFIATAFFLLPHRWRWFLLLSASYFFYANWNPKYLVVLFAMTVIGYAGGRLLERQTQVTVRRSTLAISLAMSLAILFFFKYAEFSRGVLQAAIEQMGIGHLVPGFQLLLPLGLSYFTFQTMSYLIDVYRGTITAERHAGIYALFISFFPQLTAGPIARANHLLPQLRAVQSPEYEQLVSGLQRMAWGFFKKLVIADRLAVLVNAVYGDPTSFTGTALILATYAFAFQVYCDFSGYADIAIGAARALGFKLEENFQQPYYAQSIPDFWRRWHITLYNWLRDYLFYPLSRALKRSSLPSNGFLALVLPPMLTMLASGLWHGTNWTFLVWGGLHGLFMVMAVLWNRSGSALRLPFNLPPNLISGIKIFATFHAVCFAWIFFRASSISDALYIIRHLLVNLEFSASFFAQMPIGRYDALIALAAILLMEIIHWQQRMHGSLRDVVLRQPALLRWSVYYGLVLVILMFGKLGAGEFIYARF